MAIHSATGAILLVLTPAPTVQTPPAGPARTAKRMGQTKKFLTGSEVEGVVIVAPFVAFGAPRSPCLAPSLALGTVKARSADAQASVLTTHASVVTFWAFV